MVTITPLEEENGRPVVHLRIKTPMVMSNRSMINIQYRPIDTEDELLTMSSSRGNEEYVKKYADKIGKDVLGQNHIGYMHVKGFKNENGGEGVYIT